MQAYVCVRVCVGGRRQVRVMCPWEGLRVTQECMYAGVYVHRWVYGHRGGCMCMQVQVEAGMWV